MVWPTRLRAGCTRLVLGPSRAADMMPAIVPPLIACGALTQIIPYRARALIGAGLDNRGTPAQIAFGFVCLYVIIVMAPSASAPFIYFQF